MQRPGIPTATTLGALIVLAAMSGVWAWWAAADGAYFGSVMYPGVLVLAAVFALVASRTALNTRVALTTPARIALAGLGALAAWSALSILWSPAPDVALADAQRIFGYALAFALGLWLCTLLGGRRVLATLPLAVAGLVAGAVAVIGLLTGDEYALYVDAGTLQFPLGYRNANAAFFLIALFPAVTLAATRELDWRLRALALAVATLCLQLAMLSQSRGSMIGAALALVVYLVASRERARAVGWLGLAVLPALLVIPALTDLYATAELEEYAGTTELRAAGRTVLAGSALALVLGAIAALVGARITPRSTRATLANRAVGAGAILLVVLGAVAFTVATGDPRGWVDERLDEFFTQRSPDSDAGSSRFGANAGSERDDLWRVALEQAGEEPLLGTGGGGYHYAYLLHRGEEGIESARDAHSVELEVLSELGIPGLALLALAIAGAAAGAWRRRRDSPSAAALSACALTAAAYWLGHASVDWFWAYPAVTAPVFAILGSASATAAAEPVERRALRSRRVAVVAAALLALTLVPPYLAERYVDAAYAGWRSDPARAQSDLDRARALNPLSIDPLLAEGGIALARSERERAIAAFELAADERPEEWASHYFLAKLTRRSDAARARAELARARALNPRSRQIADLRERLRSDGSDGSDR